LTADVGLGVFDVNETVGWKAGIENRPGVGAQGFVGRLELSGPGVDIRFSEEDFGVEGSLGFFYEATYGSWHGFWDETKRWYLLENLVLGPISMYSPIFAYLPRVLYGNYGDRRENR